MNEYLMIASVLRPQGVRGECRLRSFAADIDMFHNWHTLFRKDGESFVPVAVRTVRIRDGIVYAHLDESDSANAAERFRGVDLYISRNQTAPLTEDAALIADLIGCEAVDDHGKAIGVLSDVLQYGTVDTWVFRTEKGILMAPALKSVFPEVDTVRKRILAVREKLEEVAVLS